MTLEGDPAAPVVPAHDVTTAGDHETVTARAERSERSAGTHFPCLDAYRGIGMTMVLLNHAAYATGFPFRDTPLSNALTPFIARLDLSVPMFFVMSAFLLYRPFAKATLQDR